MHPVDATAGGPPRAATISAADIQRLFRTADGGYHFARWARPIAPVVFGVDDATLSVVKGACEAVVTLAGHKMAETDPELGANLMVFFMRDWEELAGVPGLDRLVPELATLLNRLQAEDANQYRLFRFEPDGAIKAAFVFLRMDEAMAQLSAEALALGQMVQVILLWSAGAFADRSALARLDGGATILRPDIAALIRAAYDPVMPASACDPSHALRLAARLGQTK